MRDRIVAGKRVREIEGERERERERERKREKEREFEEEDSSWTLWGDKGVTLVREKHRDVFPSLSPSPSPSLWLSLWLSLSTYAWDGK